MDKWYSREPITSTVAASQIVFNINNCVELSKVIHSRPPRPPDSKGRECYVYVLDGSCVRNIRDLPIDDLAPWNSKMCKSSTRFNAVTINPQCGDMVMRRYIVSDTDNVPECLLACYYCKHPTFKLAKKIFYACDGRREACLPGSYVVFIYEFEGVETLYQRTYQNGSASRQPTGPRRHLTAAAAVALSSTAPTTIDGAASPTTSTTAKRGHNSISGLQNDITQTRNTLETFMNVNNNNNNNCLNNNNVEEAISKIFGNEVKLDEILQYSHLFADHLNYSPKLVSNINGGAISGSKRRKVSNSLRVNSLSLNSTKPHGSTEPAAEFRFVHISEAMLENFQQNGLCDSGKFSELCDMFNNDTFSPSRTNIYARELGGCVLLDSTISISRYFITVLWFRNPAFLLNDEPLIHPIAVLISTKKRSDDYKFLLNEVQAKLQTNNKIVRAVFAPESLALEEFNMFDCPTVKLNCIRNFENALSERFPDENLTPIFESDLLNTEGIFNSLCFEDFVRRLGQVNKKWPSSFRTWFQEKCGWIFERLSYGSRLKAGFFSKTSMDLESVIKNIRENFIERFNVFLENSGLEFGLLAAVTALNELTNEIFVSCAQTIFNDHSAKTTSIDASYCRSSAMEEEEDENNSVSAHMNNVGPSTPTESINDNNTEKESSRDGTIKSDAHNTSNLVLHPSLRPTCSMTKQEWMNRDAGKRQEILTQLGFSTISYCELCVDANNGIHPELFKALNRQERIELLSKAFELHIDHLSTTSFDQHIQKQNNENCDEQRFIVFDNTEKSFYYVSGSYNKHTTYCQCQKQKIANFATSVIKTLVCEHLCAAALFDKRFSRALHLSFSSPAISAIDNDIFNNNIPSINADRTDSSCSSSTSMACKPFDIQLENSTVEIIRCSTQSAAYDLNKRSSLLLTPPSNNSLARNGFDVNNIANSLQNRDIHKNEIKKESTLQPFDNNCEKNLETILLGHKIKTSLSSTSLENENLY